MSDEQPTRSELRGSALWITLDRPEARNALSAPLVAALLADLRRAMSDPRVRAVVLTGAGTAFCAGADLKNRGDMGGAGRRQSLRRDPAAGARRREAGDRRGEWRTPSAAGSVSSPRPTSRSRPRARR